LVFIFVALFALVMEPVVIGARTRSLRNEVTRMVDPARSAAESVEISLSLGVAATRAYLLTREPRYLRELADAEAARDASRYALDTRTRPLGDTLAQLATKLRESVEEWEQRSRDLLKIATRPEAVGARLYPQDSSYHDALIVADSLEATLTRALDAKRAAIANIDRIGIAFQVGLVVLGGIAAIMVGLLDRRAERLVVENEERTARLQRQAIELARRDEERERLLRSEREARLEADAANRAKSEFLAGMSHELRTPLNAISGYVELIALGIRGPITHQQREDLRRIQRSQRTLLSLINDLLNFVKLDAGHVELEREVVSLKILCEELEALIGPQLNAKKLNFVCAPFKSDISVIGDADRIEQIMLNLLTNAIKFTEPQGHIHVEAEVSAGQALVHVRDTGRGISLARLQDIFDPFVQVDRHLTADRDRGVGLGLAISRELARKMGGDVTVKSEEGVGSVFTMSLPLATGADAAKEQEPSAGEG
jgi:signal transduction histidine kinase